MDRNWYDERGPDDAPIWYSFEAASAWANGYNAAIEEYNRELARVLKKEMGL
jgi:hypothetical protein